LTTAPDRCQQSNRQRGTGPEGDIMSESGGAIISVRRGDFIGISNVMGAFVAEVPAAPFLREAASRRLP
jgi:hypothetical protein